MADGQLRAVIRRVRGIVGDPEAGGLSDAGLLERFLATRDEAAFEVLLWRHGPMVLSLCKRLLRHHQDAEDAFQATFLVLVRKARSIARHRSVGSWLYKVAYRVALEARDRAMRRARREQPLVDVPAPEPADDLVWRDLRGVLDEEVSRLPEKYRAAVVLCLLAGKTKEEAAQELGCPQGTVSSRLAWARERLRDRLARRGLDLSIGVLAAGASVAVPASLVAATLRGMKGTTPTLSTQSIALAEGVLRAMTLIRWKVGATLLLAASVLTIGTGLAALPAGMAKPPTAQGTDQPKPEKPQPRLDLHGDPLPEGVVARLGTVRWRHEGQARSMCFSPDGRVLAVTSKGGLIFFFDTATGRVLHRLSTRAEFSSGVGPIAFSPDGKVFAVQTGGCRVHLWDLADRKLVRTLASAPKAIPLEGMENICFSPDGKWLAANSGVPDLVIVWEVASGRQVAALKGHRHGNPCLAFSPDGKTLALAAAKPKVQLRDVASGRLLRGFDPDQSGVFSLAFSPDGKVLASGERDRIVLTEVATGKELGRLEGQGRHLAFTPDGKTLVAGCEDAKGRVWDMASRKERFVLDSRGWMGRSMALSADGKTVAMGTVYNLIRLWDVRSGKELFPEPDGHDAPVHAVAFSPDGKLLVTGGANQQIRFWDANSGRPLGRLTGSSAKAVSFSPDGRRLATAWLWNKHVRIWDVPRAKELLAIPHEGADEIVDAAFASDGKTVVSLRYKRSQEQEKDSNDAALLHVWDAATGKSLRTVTVGDWFPDCLALSPNGRLAAVAAHHGSLPLPPLRLYDLQRDKALLSLSGHEGIVVSLAFSPDGRVLASGGGDQSVRLWEVATGKEILAMRGHTRSVAAVAFSPDGRVVASAEGQPVTPHWDGSKPHRLCLWDVATGRLLASRDTHDADVTSLAFASDGKRLVSGLHNGTVLIWDTTAWTRAPAPPVGNRSAQQLDALWATLAEEKARKAYDAIARLAAAPGQAVSYLRARLRPAEPVDAATVRRLLADLDSDLFTKREAATQALSRLGAQVEAALQKELARSASLETRMRISRLLDQVSVPTSPESVRDVRAVWVLERAGTEAAQRVLESLAKGAPEARLTQEAKTALGRLAKRPISGR